MSSMSFYMLLAMDFCMGLCMDFCMLSTGIWLTY